MLAACDTHDGFDRSRAVTDSEMLNAFNGNCVNTEMVQASLYRANTVPALAHLDGKSDSAVTHVSF